MSNPLLSVTSPVWVWLLPLLRTAMELDRAVNGPQPSAVA